MFKDRFHIFNIDRGVAAVFAELKTTAQQRVRPCPDLDLLIAATAKAHRLVVATLNKKHFIGLQGVAVEDWSI